MTTEEMKTIFGEIAKSGIELHCQYNLGFGKDNYQPGNRYNMRYDKNRGSFRVIALSGQDCGVYPIDAVLMWMFRKWWKIDDMFVDEWLKQHWTPELISQDVEELL